FSRFWNRVKSPDQLAGTNIEGTHDAARSSGRVFGNRSSCYDKVLINSRRRSYGVFCAGKSVRNSSPQIDRSIFSKIVARRSRPRIESDQSPIKSTEQNSPVVAVFALPVRDATVLEESPWCALPGLRIKFPNLLTAFRIERDHAIGGS